MKKIGIAALALLLAGCMQAALPSAQGASSPSPAVIPSDATVFPGARAGASQQSGADALAALLPGKAGFRWQYFGFAEYAMNMTLKSVISSGPATIYSATGKVADMSGKSDPAGAFNLNVVYTVSPGVLSQKLTGDKVMDSVIPALELIRSPLAVGTKWEQTVQMQGKPITLFCSIDSMKTAEGRKVYLVSYRQQGGDYYELRDIAEGFGVTAFQRLYKYDGGSDLIGYRLNAQGMQSSIQDYKQWLPPLGKQFTYFGLAEYGHHGALSLVSSNDKQDMYEYKGTFSDGRGDESKFAVDYRVDLARGTVTEQVVSNERGAAEINSKLHNLVVLKFPLSAGERWNHQAKLNGREVTVQAEVEQFDETQGIVKIRYTAKDAGGNYNDTYIEERTYEKGYGMTAFSNLMPGDIGISSTDAKDAAKLEDAIKQHSFGYMMNKTGG
jgi:hypothetical protein